MRIDWEQQAAGLSLMQVRDILRFTTRYPCGITRGDIADRILVEEGVERRRNDYEIDVREYEAARENAIRRADTLLDALVAGGLLGEPGEEMMLPGSSGPHPGYDLTPAGFGLLRATKTKRITRKAADAAVALLRRAIADINADPVLMHDVERVAIYGSYLTDAADLGDIDVAFTLKRRWTDKDDYRRRKAAFEAVHQPPENQIGVRDYQYQWNQAVVKRKLRAKSCIQLTDMYHVEELGCARLEIVPTDALVAASATHTFDRGEAKLVDDGGKARRILDEAILAKVAEMKRQRAYR